MIDLDAEKILIIEDDKQIIDLLRMILQTRNYQLEAAMDGEEGIEKAKKFKPDLIILDLVMPRMSGLEVIRQMREQQELKDIPVIVISGITKESEKPEEFWRLGLGADDFISKPFDPISLLGRVQSVLRQRQYVSYRAATDQKDAAVQPVQPQKKEDAREWSPEDVVRKFVEAWNSQDFSTEYECLSVEMRGGLPLREYVQRRRQRYRDEHGERRQQVCEQINMDKQSHQVAHISCQRNDLINDRIRQQQKENYILRKTPEGWKIAAVKRQ